ncbi:MAG: hypothetical protein DYG96_06480 [Chlorobi bacterium CHB2]|nr:hypothetical protein [Chlorobi bacterium CHB2]
MAWWNRFGIAISYLRFMLLRVSYIFWFGSLAIGAFVAYKLLRDTPIASPSYLGAASCQSCHSSSRSGDVFDVWVHSKHASAYQAMSKELSRNPGIGDSAECYRCHTTASPGSEYSSYGNMTDESRFLANGGVKGSLSDCGHCHTEPLQRPNCSPASTATTNAEALWKQIRHGQTDTTRSANSTTTNRN